jgi:hypothetical protein
MSKNTGTSELINYFDLGVDGNVGIAGSLDVNTIANATTDTDRFLVSDSGVIKYRTGSQLLSDIGGQAAGSFVTTDTNQSITANKTFTVGFSLGSDGGSNQTSFFRNTSNIFLGNSGSNIFGFNNSNNIYFGKGSNNGGVLQWNNTTLTRYYTLPDADGTIALTSSLGAYLPLAGGTLTGALNGTTASFTGDITTSAGFFKFGNNYGIQAKNFQDTAYRTVFKLNTSNQIEIGRSTDISDIILGTASATNALTIATTGTATFSSSVKMGNASLASIATNSTGSDVIVGSGTSSSPAFQVWDDNSLSVPRFIVTRGGNVGIGTASPNAPLHVVNSSNGFIQRFAGGTSSAITGGIFAEVGRNFASIGTISNHAFNIFTNDADRFSISTNGNCTIGNSPIDAGFKLDVYGTGRFSGVVEINTNTTGLVLNRSAVTNFTGVGYLTAGIGQWFVGMRENLTSNNYIIYNENGTDALTISKSNSAATFSSSVTAQTNLGVININASQAGFVADYTGASPFKVSVSTYADTFNIYNETNAYSIIGFIRSTKNLVFNPSGGNVLIGTITDNGARLQVSGTATFSSSVADYGATITNIQDSSQGLLVRATDNDTSLYLLNLQSSNSTTGQTWVDRFAVTKAGNVGIGTASPTAKLEIQNSPVNDWGLSVWGNTTTSQSYGGIIRGGTNSSDIAFQVNNAANSSTYFSVRGDNLISTGTTGAAPYNNSTTGRSMVIEPSGVLGYLVSTRESKANIESISNIDFIKQLNPVQFNYRKKDNESNTFTDELYDNISYGFIADEVEELNKELVFYNEDGTLAGVEYNSMIAILTKAIQEQQEQINKLKNA